jgi:anti-sigma B factor antagonist
VARAAEQGKRASTASGALRPGCSARYGRRMEPGTWGGEADGVLVSTTAPPPTAGLTVAGELDTHGASFLTEAISALLKEPLESIELNLAEVSFIDSAGLGGVLRARRACADAGVSLRIGATSPAVSRLVELAGVSELLRDG